MFASVRIAAALAISVSVCGAASAAPQLTVSPTVAMLDEPVQIRAAGLKPHEVVEFTLQRQASNGTWNSSASCAADAKGVIDLATCAPTSGTYTGTDQMGLFWSLRPSAQNDASILAPKPDTYYYVVQLRASGKVLAQKKITRTSHSASVQVIPLPAPLIGKAFTPVTAGKHPAILLVGGSEGGHSMDTFAEVLAAHGFVTLSLAYFGEPTLPAKLVDVPLETIKGGLDWLSARADVNADHIGMMGVSKGGELTMLSASMFPQIKAAVGLVPSSVVWMGISMGPGPQDSSWSYAGKPLDFVPADAAAGMALGAQFAKRQPVSLEPMYSASLANADAAAKAIIPVEKINGPVLLVSGDGDAMWPSSRMSDMIMQRLQSMHHPYPDKHLHFKDAGHTAFFPYSPTFGITAEKLSWGGFNFGGTDTGDAHAAEIAWPQIVRFFEVSLSNGQR